MPKKRANTGAARGQTVSSLGLLKKYRVKSAAQTTIARRNRPASGGRKK